MFLTPRFHIAGFLSHLPSPTSHYSKTYIPSLAIDASESLLTAQRPWHKDICILVGEVFQTFEETAFPFTFSLLEDKLQGMKQEGDINLFKKQFTNQRKKRTFHSAKGSVIPGSSI